MIVKRDLNWKLPINYWRLLNMQGGLSKDNTRSPVGLEEQMDDGHKRMHKAIKLLLAYLLKDREELLQIDSKNKTVIDTNTETEKIGDVEPTSQDELPVDSHQLS